MFSRSVQRFIHKTPCYATEKSLLATLRKKTGYTFTNCKKALELHSNDVDKAEHWLNQQAQSLGWSKATKLEGRKTSQGLVAVAIDNNNATLVEVNCETDFVAKNKKFQQMVEATAKACLQFTEKQPQLPESLTKINLDSDQLRVLLAPDGKSLADHLALMIGSIGENATLRRAICLKANEGIYISGYAHPSGTSENNVLLGKFGGLVALKQAEPKDIEIANLGKNICQHVVGMNPKKIGGETDKPATDADEETCLIFQEYLIDTEQTVKEVLVENGIEVVDFKRFECGERLNTFNEQPLETIETCQ